MKNAWQCSLVLKQFLVTGSGFLLSGGVGNSRSVLGVREFLSVSGAALFAPDIDILVLLWLCVFYLTNLL